MQLGKKMVNKNKQGKFLWRIVVMSLRFVVEFADAFVICVILVSLIGCQSMSRFGMDKTDYTSACEMAPLKLPAGSLALSKRYDIPDIPGNKDLILSENVPPDYY